MARVQQKNVKRKRPKRCACKKNKGNKKCWCDKKKAIACFCQDKFGRMSKMCECHKKKSKRRPESTVREKVCACRPGKKKVADCVCPDQPAERKDCLCEAGRDLKGRKGNKCFCGDRTGTKSCNCKNRQAEKCLVQ